MAEFLKEGEALVQIGVTALRAPNGDFLPSVPMYIKVGAEQVNPKTGLSVGEEDLCGDIARVMAGKFKQYADGVKALARTGK